MLTDPYLYPGTNVLKNLEEIEDHDRLQLFEAISTANRISELHLKPITGLFDIVHLQAIHWHIFQDVYGWAGRCRTLDIRRESEFWFCRVQFIQQALIDLFDKLNRENKLRNTAPQRFGERAGYYMTELNAIHPFREGNGRAQREFIRELGLNAGMHVDWAGVTRDELYAASAIGFQRADYQPMGELITRITTAMDLM